MASKLICLVLVSTTIVLGLIGTALAADKPDLTGQWKNVTVTYYTTTVIKGELEVTNLGTGIWQSTRVSYYLSDDENLDPKDTFINTRVCSPLAAGLSKTVFSLDVLMYRRLEGKFLIAVVDSTNKVAESNEGNNYAVYPF